MLLLSAASCLSRSESTDSWNGWLVLFGSGDESDGVFESDL